MDTSALVDPDTYVAGVPYDALRRLRDAARGGVGRGAAGPRPGRAARGSGWCCGTPTSSRCCAGPAVLVVAGRHPDPRPGTPDALAYVRRMMLNMDPPDHSRLRRLLARSFTPRAVDDADRPDQAHARRDLVDRSSPAPPGSVRLRQRRRRRPAAADAGRRPRHARREDRWLMFDWSNRVIGYQDPDYASSAAFDGDRRDADGPRGAWRCGPRPAPTGRMPDPRTRAGMPDLYAYAHAARRGEAPAPGRRRHVDPARPGRRRRRAVSVEEFENMFWLFAVAGNETLRNGLPGGCSPCSSTRTQQARAARRPGAAADRGRGDAALVDAGHDVPPHRDGRHRARRHPIRARRQGGRVVLLGQPRRARVRRPRPVRHRPRAQPAPGRSGTARTSVSARTWPGCRCGRCSPRCCAVRRAASAPASPSGCGRTSSTASSACRSAGPPPDDGTVQLSGSRSRARARRPHDDLENCRSAGPPDRDQGSTVTLMASPLATMSNASTPARGEAAR